MTRPVDTSKIDKVKEAAMKLIVEKGYGGATISEIARMAGVSDGYLYRHFTSKLELFQYLYESHIPMLHSTMDEIIERVDSYKEFLHEYIQIILNTTARNPIIFQFLFTLAYDYSFPLPNSPVKMAVSVSNKIREKGIATGQISSERTVEEVHAVVIGVPVIFLDLRLRGIFWSKNISEDDVKGLIDICMKALS